jgi:hypothetical protein
MGTISIHVTDSLEQKIRDNHSREAIHRPISQSKYLAEILEKTLSESHTSKLPTATTATALVDLAQTFHPISAPAIEAWATRENINQPETIFHWLQSIYATANEINLTIRTQKKPYPQPNPRLSYDSPTDYTELKKVAEDPPPKRPPARKEQA